VARIAGEAIGADTFLPNMGTEEFLSCLSRIALEGACAGTSVLPRPRVKDTRAELVKHFAEARFVHPSALFAPPIEKVTAWVERFSGEAELDDEPDASPENAGVLVDAHAEDGEADVDEPDVYQPAGGFAEAAE
jgi:ParB family transcriptional regulator, chromosome partitioning protein